MKNFFISLLRLGLILSLPMARGADVPISGLPAISSVTATTILPVVDTSGTPATKKATAAQLIGGLPLATGSTVGVMSAADKTLINSATETVTAFSLVKRDGSSNFSGNVIMANAVTGLASPVNATDAANKSYVDASSAGLIIHAPVVAATTGSNITLTAGAPTVLDGVTLLVNNRILVKDQTDNTQNGIYFVATLGTGANGTWTRSTDADTGAELPTGSYTFIAGGTINANAAYTMTTPGTIVIGTSPIVWNLFSQVTQILASNILGQIITAQIADDAINLTKLANGLTAVEIASSLPSSGNFTGRTVYLTTDGKIYRYTGSSFTAAVPTVDLTGQITTTQVSDNAISTPKLQALSITAGKVAANAITAGTIATDAVTAGTIAAAAINTRELAAGAVTAAKITSGTITANQIAASTITGTQIQAGVISSDKINTIQFGTVGLSAITGNIGTITAGTITANTNIAVGSGTAAVTMNSSGLNIAAGRVSMTGDGSNPFVRAYGAGGHSSEIVEINGGGSFTGPFIQAVAGSASVLISPQGGLTMGNNKPLTILSGSTIQGPGTLDSNPDSSGSAINFRVGETGSSGTFNGYLRLIVNGREVRIPFYLP